MIIVKTIKKLLPLILTGCSFFIFTSSFQRCVENDEIGNIIELLKENDYLSLKHNDTINILYFYNAIRHKRYYVLKGEVTYSVVKTTNKDDNQDYYISRGVGKEDESFMDSVIKTDFKRVPSSFISSSCNECYAVDYYKMVVKGTRIKKVTSRELIPVYGYW